MLQNPLWAQPAQATTPSAVALACLLEAQRQIGTIPGAEEDWDLVQALTSLRAAIEDVQSYQSRQD